jgi:preprotein translocase subunit SecA
MGMKEGEAIEDRMVSRQVGRAQKKVEEQHFDMRKNLLEYDEVMDLQRKRVYGKRQELLNDGNPKVMILEFVDGQIAKAVGLYLDPDFGPSSFAEFIANRLPVSLENDRFTAADFRGSDFDIACQTAFEKAHRHVETAVHDSMDENLSLDEDASEWKWQEMARAMNARYGLKLTDRQLKQIGRDHLAAFLIEEANKSIEQVDLTPGKKYLQPDWGRIALADWVRQKFLIRISPEELTGTPDAVRKLLGAKVREVYRQKEIAFPVQVGIATYLSERPGPDGRFQQQYDRAGLLEWAKLRFGPAAEGLSAEEFHTAARSQLQETLLKVSEKYLGKLDQSAIDGKLAEALAGADRAEAEDARELAEWAKSSLGVEVSAEALTGVSRAEARRLLWNAFDDRYRPEMHRMERGLVLDRLDNAWKRHLLQMDHLRNTVGLRGYAQADPKSEYKREGMKEFDVMWEGLQDKVTDAVFRMEEEPDFQDTIWAGATAMHARVVNDPLPMPTDTNDMTTNSSEAPKKVEPIRNKGEKIGRNDPCPCGSGKKYKNCHMRGVSPKR